MAAKVAAPRQLEVFPYHTWCYRFHLSLYYVLQEFLSLTFTFKSLIERKVCCAGQNTCCPHQYVCVNSNATCMEANPSKNPYATWQPQWNLCQGPIPLEYLPNVVDGLAFPFYSDNGALASPQRADVEMIVVVVHGASRNADE